MKLSTLLLRPASSPERPCFYRRRAVTCNQILSTLQNSSPMEHDLDRLLPNLSSNIVTSVLQQVPNPKLGFRFFIWSTRTELLHSRASDSLIVDMLVKDKHGFDLYWETLQDLKNFQIPITSNAFRVLIAGYAKMGMAEKAVEAFSTMKDFDCKPDVFTYNCVLHVMMRKQVFLLALAVYNQMLKSNCGPDLATYNILIDGLYKIGKTQDALNLFDEISQRGISPNEITCTIIVSGLCQAKRLDEAHRLFNTMKESGLFPDAFTCSALLNGFCKSGRLDEAYALLRTFETDGFPVGLVGYSCLIDGLFRAKRYKEALAWFRKILKEDVKPDVVLYTIMIQGLSNAGRVQDALKLLGEMAERDLAPDTCCYNAVIKGLCDIGLLDKARSLQLEISKHDCFPNASTYTVLICGMCRNGLVEEAQLIFNDMEKLGCFPSVVTFNALIDGLCKARQLEEAHILFYKMEIGRNPSVFLRLSQGANRGLDKVSLQTMVEQLCESGLILKAYKLLTQLADSGVVPDIITYNILINGFCKARNINGAFKLFKDLQLKGLSPDSITYGTLIDALYRVDREEDAVGVFDQMQKNGITPSVAVYKSLMTWSCRKRKVSLAISLWLKYLRSLPGREEGTIKAVEEHFEKGEVEKAIRGILEMDYKMKDFDRGPYTILLIGFCQARRVDETMAIYSVLEDCKIIVTPPSCVKLIHGLCREGNLDLAINVFLYSIEKGFMLMPRACNRLLWSLLRSQDKKEHVLDLVSKMKSFGYDLNRHLYRNTKALLHGHRNSREMEYMSRA
ncbi:pentatricopeptide repeat-containing protein At1g79540 [Corylus avellana]|uniref:pentatricopeptide repeat-containing protein At1g79540 n=1 Tax=Corylus avellana TaxID=13451 RepID=UPI00286C9C5F|nr:pentatricopeptide repeat-containing protein At1g79540 [Corylus avellana]